jgi:hypothetical protein
VGAKSPGPIFMISLSSISAAYTSRSAARMVTCGSRNEAQGEAACVSGFAGRRNSKAGPGGAAAPDWGVRAARRTGKHSTRPACVKAGAGTRGAGAHLGAAVDAEALAQLDETGDEVAQVLAVLVIQVVVKHCGCGVAVVWAGGCTWAHAWRRLAS